MQLPGLYYGEKPVISFELFPPKKWAGMASLFEHFTELATCGPSLVTCTYGAAGGGSGQGRTLDVLDWIRSDYPEIPVASHLTCVNATVDDLRAYIREAIAHGAQAIVALRGDPPSGKGTFEAVKGGFRHADELVSLLRREFPELKTLVAGYPETHPEAPSAAADIENLKRKVDAGADVVLTQLFYDNDLFFHFRDRCDQAGITAPIVPGILPVTNLAQIKRMTTMCGATVTEKLLSRLEAHGEDAEGQFSVGVYYATRQVEELVEQGVPGIHFYVLNKSRAAAMICRSLTLYV